MIYAPVEDGQGLAEYAIILVLIAVAVIAILAIFGTQVSTLYSRITSSVAEA